MKKIKKILNKIMTYEFLYRFKKSIYKFKISDFNKISKESGISKINLSVDYIISTYIYGCCLKDYLTFDFYRKKYKDRKKYVVETDGKLVNVFNSKATKKDRDIFDKKNIFNNTFKKFISRESIYCEEKNEEQIIEVINRFDEIIVKSTNLNGGKGIEVLSVNKIKDLNKFAKKAKKEKKLIEERLKQHSAISRLNPTSINTVRIVTIKNEFNSDVNIIGCSIRIGKKDSFFDNLSQGAIAFPIDIEKGIVCGLGKDLKGNTYYTNDIGNVVMEGYQIPNWALLIKTVKEAANIVPNMRYIGWDVCIKDKSIELIEGNCYPGPRTYQLGDFPKKQLIKEIIKSRMWKHEKKF